MGEITIGELSDDLMQRLNARAASHERTMAEELRAIISEALARPALEDVEEFKRLAAQSRALSAGRLQTPSEELLRGARDER